MIICTQNPQNYGKREATHFRSVGFGVFCEFCVKKHILGTQNPQNYGKREATHFRSIGFGVFCEFCVKKRIQQVLRIQRILRETKPHETKKTNPLTFGLGDFLTFWQSPS